MTEREELVEALDWLVARCDHLDPGSTMHVPSDQALARGRALRAADGMYSETLTRGLASACDAIVGDLHLLDSGQQGDAKTITSIRATMDRLYEQFPDAAGA